MFKRDPVHIHRGARQFFERRAHRYLSFALSGSCFAPGPFGTPLYLRLRPIGLRFAAGLFTAGRSPHASQQFVAWPAAAFRLCLSHTPDNINWARQRSVDLMLAGHVHGGQIRLPLIGSIFCPSRYSRRYDCGTFFEAPTVMHVSRGLAGQHPLRYGCRPEVTRLILTGKTT